MRTSVFRVVGAALVFATLSAFTTSDVRNPLLESSSVYAGTYLLGETVNNLNKAESTESVHLIGNGRFDFLFEPLELEAGERYTFSALTNVENASVSYKLEQLSRTETAIGLDLGGIIEHIESEVELKTTLNGETTHSSSIAKTSVQDLGVVTAPSNAWAETVHVVVVGGKVTIILDPEDTFIDLAHVDVAPVPFQTIEISFSAPNLSVSELVFNADLK